MLGNDRANEFWAARLSVSEELDCDASPEQRRDFIAQKYRDGRFRLAHPGFNSQEELLKVRLPGFPAGRFCSLFVPRQRTPHPLPVCPPVGPLLRRL